MPVTNAANCMRAILNYHTAMDASEKWYLWKSKIRRIKEKILHNFIDEPEDNIFERPYPHVMRRSYNSVTLI